MTTPDDLRHALKTVAENLRYWRDSKGEFSPTVRELSDTLKRVDAALAAAPAAPALPLKARPDFIAGYDAGLDDGKRMLERYIAEQEASPYGLDAAPAPPNEVARLQHNISVLTDALWKACGDDETTVQSIIDSQGDLL